MGIVGGAGSVEETALLAQETIAMAASQKCGSISTLNIHVHAYSQRKVQ